MKFASFKYDVSNNLGDEIQSLAAEQFLPQVDIWLNRDSLNQVKLTEKHLLIMNGWFSRFPETCFPPVERIIPIFFSMHISDWWEEKIIRHFLQPNSLAYFKKHEPVGCRDQKTMKLLKDQGIQAFYSKCLTLTFPERKRPPENGKVFVVDINKLPMPESLREKSKFLTHRVSDDLSNLEKRKMAQNLLNRYRDEAELVVTKRLHCALPCIAMGIPVIFFGNADDYRISILKDLKVPIHSLQMPLKAYKESNWYPEPVDFREGKKQIIQNIQNQMREKLNSEGFDYRFRF